MSFAEAKIRHAREAIDRVSIDRVAKNYQDSPYPDSYWALLNLASKVQDNAQNQELLALSLAIYGWMPTILKKPNVNDFKVENPIGCIRDLSNVEDALVFLSNSDAQSPINNSWVGLSKLLHFLNPALFPIWDSRIARHFSLKASAQHNKKNVYLSYFDFVHSQLTDFDVKIELLADRLEMFPQKAGDQNRRPTKVRCFELMLFLSEAKT